MSHASPFSASSSFPAPLRVQFFGLPTVISMRLRGVMGGDDGSWRAGVLAAST